MNLLIDSVKSIEVSRRHMSGGCTIVIKATSSKGTEEAISLTLLGNIDAIEALPKAADFYDANNLMQEAAE